MIKASFVVPVKNGGKFIAKTLKSLVNQKEKNIEIIIVNDHSTDNTTDIVKKLKKFDKRIKLLENPTKKTGEAATRNYGTKFALGEIILPTDADDPNSLERASISIRELHSNRADIFYGTLEHYYLETGKKERRFFQPYDAELLRYICYINHAGASAYLRKSFNKLGGYDPTIKIGTDYDLWLRAQEKGFKFVGKDIVLAQYTIHKNQMTSTSITERHCWLKMIRQKHQIYTIDMDYIKKNARKETIDFFIKNPYYNKIWFSQESLPK